MTETTLIREQLAYGRKTAVPDDAKAAWGARLIAPNDLVSSRQDLAARTDGDKAALVAWLNGSGYGDGAIRKAKDWLAENYDYELRQDFDQVLPLYEDETGIIVGSTNASYGYVYVAAWLKEGTA